MRDDPAPEAHHLPVAVQPQTGQVSGSPVRIAAQRRELPSPRPAGHTPQNSGGFPARESGDIFGANVAQISEHLESCAQIHVGSLSAFQVVGVNAYGAEVMVARGGGERPGGSFLPEPTTGGHRTSPRGNASGHGCHQGHGNRRLAQLQGCGQRCSKGLDGRHFSSIFFQAEGLTSTLIVDMHYPPAPTLLCETIPVYAHRSREELSQRPNR